MLSGTAQRPLSTKISRKIFRFFSFCTTIKEREVKRGNGFNQYGSKNTFAKTTIKYRPRRNNFCTVECDATKTFNEFLNA